MSKNLIIKRLSTLELTPPPQKALLLVLLWATQAFLGVGFCERCDVLGEGGSGPLRLMQLTMVFATSQQALLATA